VARGHHLLPAQKQRGPGPLLLRLDDTKAVLDRVYQELNHGAESGLDISPAGDWLLDNFYIVQEHIREIRTNLPKGYYEELPKLSTGSLAGYPRAYEVAIELIAHTEGHLDLDNITLFVREYQTVTSLRMGELWAIPTMLRLGLVENIRRMALRVAARLKEVESADRAATILREASEESSQALALALAAFVDEHPPFTPTWVARFLQQVRSYQTNFTPLIWLEQWIAEDGPSAEEAATRSNRLEGFRRIAERDRETASPGSKRSLRVDDVRYTRSLPPHCRARGQAREATGGRDRWRSPGAGQARRPDRCETRSRRLLPRREGAESS
jgi:cyclic beta-1,2-glucan synthetase